MITNFHSLIFVCLLCFAAAWAADAAEIATESHTDHWAFAPPVAHEVPEVDDASGAVTWMDRFVLAKLEEAGLSPSAPADRRTLIRRAYFDLIGLPPTHEQVQAFANDPSPHAFEKVVDELLASPHYGERWARHWLDLARYADTKGYVYGDREERFFVHAHQYRDWVVQALNDDLPYDQFLRLQIAADKIDPQTPRSLAAMGFLTIGRRFLGVEPEVIDDRIDTLMRTTQGLTVACARCHDHKFDPIPTADYYSLYGVFDATAEQLVRIDTAEAGGGAYEKFQAELRKREANLNNTFEAKKAEVLHRMRMRAGDYLAAVPDVADVPTEVFFEAITPDDLLPIVVRRWNTYLYERSHAFDPIFEPWHRLAEVPRHEQVAKAEALFAKLLAGDAKALHPLIGEALAKVQPRSLQELAALYGKLLGQVETMWQMYRAVVPIADRLPDTRWESLREVLYGDAAATRLPSGSARSLSWYFDEKTRVELGKLQKEIETLIAHDPGAPAYAMTLVDRDELRNPRIFLRGNQATPGPQVPRQFLQVIEGEDREPFTSGSGRMELAHRIANRDNPLTARVWINRIWQQHFGQGFVESASDFGTRSTRPVHADLLDTLAVRFMDEGWSTRSVHRTIMLSATYQQQSAHRADAFAKDAANRLLWRMPARRLDLESMRDAMLAVTGELDRTVGGKGETIFPDTGGRNTIWGTVAGTGAEASKRRSIYGLIDRQFLPDVYRVFDFANPDIHIDERPTTTVPQQALFLANHDFAHNRAIALMNHPAIASTLDTKQRITRLYAQVLQRVPSSAEIAAGMHFLELSQAAAAQTPPPLSYEQTAWRYGFGTLEEGTSRVKGFTPLPHFTGDAWQGGAKWPDEKLGWVQITATGGHVGNDLAHASIRRWIAPMDAELRIIGSISHKHEVGDGVSVQIVSSSEGIIDLWKVHNRSQEIRIENIFVKAGDTIDFVADMNENLNSDDYEWPIVIESLGANAKAWDSVSEFAGPAPAPPLDPWQQYAQVLLMSNEFFFVD